MVMFGKRLQCTWEEVSRLLRSCRGVEEECCVVEPDLWVLGEFLHHCLQQAVCFLSKCQLLYEANNGLSPPYLGFPRLDVNTG